MLAPSSANKLEEKTRLQLWYIVVCRERYSFMWSIRDSLNCGCGGSAAPTKKLYSTSILPFSNVGYTVCVRDAHRLTIYCMNQPYYRGTKSSQICDDHCLTQLVWFWYDNLSHTNNGLTNTIWITLTLMPSLELEDIHAGIGRFSSICKSTEACR